MIGKGAFWRLAGLVVIGAGIVAAWRWRTLFDPLALTNLLTGNPLAPAVFIGVHVAASLFFVPRTWLAAGAGLVFGMWWGILWAALGSLGGAIAGFLIARYLYAGFVERSNSERVKLLLARAERGGWRMVALVRLVPIIPHSLTNYAMGLTRVGLGAYVLGSLLGQLPLTIAFTDLGAAGGQLLLGAADWRQALWPSLIALSALALSLLIPLLARRRLRPAQPAPGA
jgi:uncharacterized membrane protein YdjX (TVP38/TMEM64 family)